MKAKGFFANKANLLCVVPIFVYVLRKQHNCKQSSGIFFCPNLLVIPVYLFVCFVSYCLYLELVFLFSQNWRQLVSDEDRRFSSTCIMLDNDEMQEPNHFEWIKH